MKKELSYLSPKDSLVMFKFVNCRQLWESEFWGTITASVEAPDKNRCWLWGGIVGGDGLPYFTICGRYTREATKLAYMLENDTNDAPRFISHSCHNPLCVNPVHFLID